jgi:Ca2+-binding RTX toxin-like protein
MARLLYDAFLSDDYTTSDFAVVRYNSNGSLDAGFGIDGKVITDFGGLDTSLNVAIQSDGRIVAIGASSAAPALFNNDNLFGSPGNNRLFGNQGEDFMTAGTGDDIVTAGKDNDGVLGGTGNDVLSGNLGNDQLLGNDGDDVIFGNAGIDYIDAGNGNDIAFGGRDNDGIAGGEGDDVLLGNWEMTAYKDMRVAIFYLKMGIAIHCGEILVAIPCMVVKEMTG